MIRMGADTLRAVRDNQVKKGDVLTVAQVAGIQAAKSTSSLIPLCHALPLEQVSVEFEVQEEGIRAHCRVRCTGKTGVEMEALSGVSRGPAHHLRHVQGPGQRHDPGRDQADQKGKGGVQPMKKQAIIRSVSTSEKTGEVKLPVPKRSGSRTWELRGMHMRVATTARSASCRWKASGSTSRIPGARCPRGASGRTSPPRDSCFTGPTPWTASNAAKCFWK
jgi:hypothetical protein